jgi:hypothetical protein
MTDDLVKMARLAQRDDRMATGALYGDLADRIEELTAELAKAVEGLLLARVHVANNEQGWSVGRASARSDLKIINALLAEIENSEAVTLGEKT